MSDYIFICDDRTIRKKRNNICIFSPFFLYLFILGCFSQNLLFIIILSSYINCWLAHTSYKHMIYNIGTSTILYRPIFREVKEKLKRGSRRKMKPAGGEASPSTSRESWLLIRDLGKHTQRAKGGFRSYQTCARVLRKINNRVPRLTFPSGISVERVEARGDGRGREDNMRKRYER